MANHWDGNERRRPNQDIDTILIRLSEIDIGVNVLGTKLDNLHTKVNSSNSDLKNELSKHGETIYGNGKPGLTILPSKIRDMVDLLSYEIVQNRWIFGILFAIQGWVLIRLYLIS